MKKLFAVLLAVVLVFAMGTVALAADTGTITITNAEVGETYDIYKMADFTPIAGETEKGVYTAVSGWENFFAQAPASNYFETEVIDGKTVVTMTTEPTDVQKAELAKEAVDYGKTKGATATIEATSENVVFTGLDLGYYAVDTTLGTVCALVNTNSDFTTVEKNAKPGITKEVEEDRDNTWGQVNDADIGQEVNYRSNITVGAGLTNYEMHDTMDAGLTLDKDSIAVEGATEGTDYTVEYTCADGCTFVIKFEDDFIENVAANDADKTFTVTYSATLNEDAKVAYDKGTDDYEGNMNRVHLEYFNESVIKTDEIKTVTYTWKLDVFKYTMDGENKTPLAGATFQLLDKDGNAIKFSEVAGAATPTYVVDPENGKTDIDTDSTGDITFIGLDEGKYSLREVSAPAGYNKIANDIEVVIGSNLDHENLKAEFGYVQYDEGGEAIVDADDNLVLEDPATIEVENKTGGLFPETGGIGTTIFYIVGGLLMLAAVVILVSKKRMSAAA